MAALLLAASLLPLQAEAAKKKARHATAAAPAVKESPAAVPVQPPIDFADAFHEAMRLRDRTKVLSMLAPDLVVFETGYLQATRDDYVKSNLDDDTAFASATVYRPLSRGVIGSGDSMTVLTKASIQGVVGGQSIDLVQSETMILRRIQATWEIVHLHWSAHTRQADEPGPRVQVAPPAQRVEPELPVQPAEPETPAQPIEPEIPAQPVEPELPAQPSPQPPVQPLEPDLPAQPIEPELPAQPVEPGPATLPEPPTELTAPAVPEAKPEESKTP